VGTAAINEGNGSSLVLGATKKNGEKEQKNIPAAGRISRTGGRSKDREPERREK